MIAEGFQLNYRALRSALGCDGPTGLAWLDQLSNADDLHGVVVAALDAGIIEAPNGLTILVYPSAVSQGDVALVTVLSLAFPAIHVVAGSDPIRRMVPHGLRDHPDELGKTVAIVETALAAASRVTATVRLLERFARDGDHRKGIRR